MKKKYFILGLCAMLGSFLFLSSSGRVLAQNVACYLSPGGAALHAGSGCSITIDSSGTLNVASGGVFQVGGTTVSGTAAELNVLAGVTPGTTAASKAVVQDASSKVSSLDATVLKANGVTVTNAAIGVAASYKIARGETALDGSNPTPVTTGLATITGCSLTIKTTTAPGVSTSVLSYDTSSGTMNMYGWKVTSAIDDTLVASTGTDTVGWVCLGT